MFAGAVSALRRAARGARVIHELKHDGDRVAAIHEQQRLRRGEGEDAYRITMAVAGFDRDELQIVSHENTLTVAGRKKQEEHRQYLHRGLATRAFQRQFNLADFVKVAGAGLENGLLTIDLVREVPEAMKPRHIEIGQGAPSNVTKLEAKAA